MNNTDRILPMEKIANVRELGGYPVTSGEKQKHVKPGLIYRSEGPAGMTGADRKVLEGRKIKTVVDFRSADEKSAFFELSGARYVELPIDAGNLMGALSGTGEWLYNPNPERAAEEMLRLYTALPGEAIPQYRVLFSLLMENTALPLLFHCSGGKDRTGLAAALILHALGASRETIVADYLLSAELLRRYWEPHLADKPWLAVYMSVREDFLAAAFTAIDAYGGMDRYITKELGVDVDRLRTFYTE